jgi:hypothetical protein
MRRWPVVCLIIGLGVVQNLVVRGADVGGSLSDRLRTSYKASYVGDNRPDAREGGETMATAMSIPSIPYSDAGATCDNVNDMGLSCAGGGASPDVFYVYSPTVDQSVDVNLCGSGYDTALGVYLDGVEIACNDDYCGLQSGIPNLTLLAGHTYHIQVDGYGASACGSYMLSVTEVTPCDIECPSGGLAEGEPPCHDGYDDQYNSGCNGAGFPTICPQGSGSSAIICGKGGTFWRAGWSYKDSDWFTCWGTGGLMTMTCVAEFPLQLIFIYWTSCTSPQYDLVTVDPCETATLSRSVPANTYVWAWVGPSVLDGVPCESDYLLTLTGIAAGPECGPTLAKRGSWGTIKSTFKP